MTPTSKKSLTPDAPRIIVLLCAFALILIGLVMVYSASMGQAVSDGTTDSSSYLTKQAIFAGAGIVLALLAWKFGTSPILRSRIVTVLLAVVTWALLIATQVYGIATNGAQRWIPIGGFTLQPSEFVKIFLVILACKLLADYREGVSSRLKSILLVLGLVLAPLFFLFFAQSDLGSAIIIGVGLLAVLWIGGANVKWVAVIIVLAALGVIASIALTPYRSGRMYFLNPWGDGENGSGNGFQLIRSFYAFAQGGIFGTGIGNSTEKLTPLPEAETDFIFAIIGEEMGLLGAIAIIVLFFAILIAGLRASRAAEDPFSATLAGALSVMLVFQALLNMACVIGVMPTTGKPLPFISSGGSSMLASVLVVGLIMTAKPLGCGGTIYDKRREDLQVVRTEKVVRPKNMRKNNDNTSKK